MAKEVIAALKEAEDTAAEIKRTAVQKASAIESDAEKQGALLLEKAKADAAAALKSAADAAAVMSAEEIKTAHTRAVAASWKIREQAQAKAEEAVAVIIAAVK